MPQGTAEPSLTPQSLMQAQQLGRAVIEEVGRVVATAADAFPAWRATSLSRRAEVLFRARELLVARRDELAAIITSEHGKVLSDVKIGINTVPPELVKDMLPPGVLEHVTRAAEREQLTALAGSDPHTAWDRVLFSAKESIYKSWYPLQRRWLGFEDVRVDLTPTSATTGSVNVTVVDDEGQPIPTATVHVEHRGALCVSHHGGDGEVHLETPNSAEKPAPNKADT